MAVSKIFPMIILIGVALVLRTSANRVDEWKYVNVRAGNEGSTVISTSNNPAIVYHRPGVAGTPINFLLGEGLHVYACDASWGSCVYRNMSSISEVTSLEGSTTGGYYSGINGFISGASFTLWAPLVGSGKSVIIRCTGENFVQCAFVESPSVNNLSGSTMVSDVSKVLLMGVKEFDVPAFYLCDPGFTAIGDCTFAQQPSSLGRGLFGGTYSGGHLYGVAFDSTTFKPFLARCSGASSFATCNKVTLDPGNAAHEIKRSGVPVVTPDGVVIPAIISESSTFQTVSISAFVCDLAVSSCSLKTVNDTTTQGFTSIQVLYDAGRSEFSLFANFGSKTEAMLFACDKTFATCTTDVLYAAGSNVYTPQVAFDGDLGISSVVYSRQGGGSGIPVVLTRSGPPKTDAECETALTSGTLSVAFNSCNVTAASAITVATTVTLGPGITFAVKGKVVIGAGGTLALEGGTLNVNGLEMTPTGIMQVLVSTPGGSSTAQLAVQGLLELSGALQLRIASGVPFNIGDVVVLARYLQVSGAFSGQTVVRISRRASTRRSVLQSEANAVSVSCTNGICSATGVAPSSPSSSSPSSDDDDTALIVGLAAAGAVLVVLFLLVAFLIVRNKKHRSSTAKPDNEYGTSGGAASKADPESKPMSAAPSDGISNTGSNTASSSSHASDESRSFSSFAASSAPSSASSSSSSSSSASSPSSISSTS